VLNPDDIKPTLFRVIRAQNDKFKKHEVTLWHSNTYALKLRGL
jgi:hypothetical protein